LRFSASPGTGLPPKTAGVWHVHVLPDESGIRSRTLRGFRSSLSWRFTFLLYCLLLCFREQVNW